jgi:hypothetical protein
MGIFEDGWSAEHVEAMLDGGAAANLVVRARPLHRSGQHLDVVVDGELLESRPADCELLELRIPLPASNRPRRVQLHWAKAAPLSKRDPRPVSARLDYLDLIPSRPPAALRFPASLNIPGVVVEGVDIDGWVGKTARMVLSGGPAADLTIRADVLAGREQELTVLIDGDQAFSQPVSAGPLHAAVPAPASDHERTVEIRWAAVSALAAPDEREAAALLRFVGMATGDPPKSLTLPRDLAIAEAEAVGVDADGWIGQTAAVVLRGGQASTLRLRADVLPRFGQRLDILINGATVWAEAVADGPLTVRAPAPAAEEHRRVELRWAVSDRLSDTDRRNVSARLRFIGIGSARTPTAVQVPKSLTSPDLDYNGIQPDGWLAQSSWLELAEGEATDLVLRAFVHGAEGRGLDVAVDGIRVASQVLGPGEAELRVPLHATTSNRRIELHWSTVGPISKEDARLASARLSFIGLARGDG